MPRNIRRARTFLKVPIDIISNGPGRDQNILKTNQFK